MGGEDHAGRSRLRLTAAWTIHVGRDVKVSIILAIVLSKSSHLLRATDDLAQHAVLAPT
tara:strand:- start:66 stop:242 length:177 start_codon:yes stop_codon:yes gene_type:complete